MTKRFYQMNTKLTPFRIIAFYAVAGALWILFSDSVIFSFIKEPAIVAELSIFKGWIFILFTSILLYCLVTIYSIQRNRSELLLRESEAALKKSQNIIENAPIGIIQSAPGGKLLAVNPMTASMFGYESVEDMLFSVNDIPNQLFAHPEQRQEIVREIISKESTTRYEVEYLRKDGTHFYANLYIKAERDIQGNVLTLEGFVTDITEHKKAEQIRLQSEKMSLIAGMAAGMAHEINNPLGIIAQNLQNLQRRFVSSSTANREIASEMGLDLTKVERYMEKREILQFIETIRSAVIRASAVISKVLHLSHASDSSHIRISLNEVIDQSLKPASSDYDLPNKATVRVIDKAEGQAALGRKMSEGDMR